MKRTRPPEPPPEETEANIISIIPTNIMMKAPKKTVNAIDHPNLASSFKSVPCIVDKLLEQSWHFQTWGLKHDPQTVLPQSLHTYIAGFLLQYSQARADM
jgi:hypothetical protein